MLIETVPSLVQFLREHRLLDSSQLTQLAGQAGQFSDAKALARELVKRGWLTPYQVNQIILGRGKELLLGPYLLLDRIGEGGMGQVFRARHQLMNRVVALKVIRKERIARPEVVRRFQREIQAVAQLSHQNIVIAHDAAQVGDTHFFVMEFVEGVDLGKLVKQRGKLPVPEACDCIRQAALGLQHAHERGLVHRDIKPHNLILANKDSVVKILDLGLARVNIVSEHSEDSGALTQEGAVMGTADYIAPEQALDTHKADIRADIYSLGCTFYHLLTGHPPFGQGTMAQKLLWHQQIQPPAVETVRQDLPPGLNHVVSRMMAKKAAERYQTPAEVAAALEVFCRAPVLAGTSASLSGASPKVSSAPTASLLVSPGASRSSPSQETVAGGTSHSETAMPMAPAPVRRPGKPRPRWAIPAAAGGAVLVLLLIWLFSGGDKPKDNPAPQPLAKPPVPGPPGHLPWDKLPPRLSADNRLPWKTPTELVAVLGEDRAHHWGPVRCLAVSADGKLAASGSNDRTVRTWDTATMTGRAVCQGHTASVLAVAISPDAKYLVSGGEDRTVRLWDAETGKEIRQFAGHGNPVMSVIFSADGQQVFTFAYSENVVRAFETKSGSLKRTFKQFSSGVNQAVFPPGNKYILIGGADSTLRMYSLDSQTETQRWSLAGKEAAAKLTVTTMALSPNGQQVLAGYSDNIARLWHVEKGNELKRFEGHGSPVQAVAFAPDGRTVCTASGDQAVRLWDIDSGKEIKRFDGHSGSVDVLAFLPGGGFLSAGLDGTIRLWDSRSGGEAMPIKGHTSPVRGLKFSLDGKQVVSSGLDGTIRIWDLQSLTEARRLEGHDGAVHNVDISPDGKRILSAGFDRTVRLWDLETRRVPLNLSVDQGDFMTFTPDGQLGCLTPGHTRLELVDLETGRPVFSGGGHVGTIRCGAVSPDSRLVLTGATDYVVRLFDIKGRKEVNRFVGHTDAVFAVSFTSDQRFFLSAGADRAVRHWNVAEEGPKKKVTLPDFPPGLTWMAFSPDAKTVAAATKDGRVLVWETGAEKKLFDWSLPGPVQRVAYSPDGRHLATANANGTVYVFRLGP